MLRREEFAPDRGRGRHLSTPGRFGSDDGSPDLAIRGAADARTLVGAVRAGRVMVAVVATADDVEVVHGRAVDKTSAMSVVSMVAKDGRRGLLSFTGIDAFEAWDPSARPVPVSGVDAALAAIADDCEGLILDIAGPRMQVVPEADVLQIAGVDQLDHARAVANRLLVEALDSDAVSVTRIGDRLQVATDLVDARDLAAMIPPRVLALVPSGVEIVDGG